jgi:mannose-1-phosphate guanylyltransferase
MQIYPIILAGGFGQRLAPISTPQKPKQFLDLLGSGESLLQSTLKRALQFNDAEKITIVGNILHERHLLVQSRTINSDLIKNLTLETESRNTAFAINLALDNYEQDGVALIMPADYYIDGPFYEDVMRAYELAVSDKIVTFGIMPEYLTSDYGYLLGGLFYEKPPAPEALRLIRAGALWNSGIFVAKISTIKAEFIKHYPDFGLNLSFDKAVMEKTKAMHVVPASFAWDDLGTPERVEKYAGYAKRQMVA